MNGRTKLHIVDGWPGKQVEYLSIYSDGSTQWGICSLEDWRVWEIKHQLVEAGVDEKLVEELYELGYSIGYDSAEMDYAERDAGESL